MGPWLKGAGGGSPSTKAGRLRREVMPREGTCEVQGSARGGVEVGARLRTRDDDVALASGDVVLTDRELALADRDVALSDGDVALTDHDVALSDGDVALTDHDVALSDGDVVPTDHDVALSDGDFALTDHDVALSEGELALTDHDVALSFRASWLSPPRRRALLGRARSHRPRRRALFSHERSPDGELACDTRDCHAPRRACRPVGAPQCPPTTASFRPASRSSHAFRNSTGPPHLVDH